LFSVQIPMKETGRFYLLKPSCYPQIISLREDAGFQIVINDVIPFMAKILIDKSINC